MLPNSFSKRMKTLLKEEYDIFVKSYLDKNIRSLRYNNNRINEQGFINIFSESITKIEYDKEGFYLNSDEKFGYHPHYLSGMYYLQDPAAMIPVNCIDIKEDYKVLDLCAAPGGKTFQISSRLTDGLLISNELNISRNKTLQSNIERLGLDNVIITSMDSKKIGTNYQNSFDAVFVDAPCSGEGMFRKYPETIDEWSDNKVLKCAEIQSRLLNDIKDTVKKNGYIVYSTCTYSLEENEMIIDEFLKNNDFILVDIPDTIKKYTTEGYLLNSNIELSKCRRFYHHKNKGEGQFVAVLKRISDNNFSNKNKTINMKLSIEEERIVNEFLNNTLIDKELKVLKYKDNIVSINMKDLNILPNNIVACGVKIGEIQKGRIIPHHHFFTAYGKHFKNKLDLLLDDKRLVEYLKGNVIDSEINNGYGVVLVNGCTLGGFKAVNNTLKNHYPKGLRIHNYYLNKEEIESQIE